MHNFWRVARHEFKTRTGKRSFLITTLALPILIVVVMGLTILFTSQAERTSHPVGYVDHAGLLSDEVIPPAMEDAVPIIEFANEESARAALSRGEIGGYYIIPEGYPQQPQLTLVYWEQPPGANARETFNRYLRANLVSGLPQQVQERILEGPEMTVRSLEGRQEATRANFLVFIMPYIIGFFFFIAVMMSAGYLLQVVTDEKESRTIEILITTVSPGQLIGGKAAGLLGVVFLQMFVWLATAGIALGVASSYFEFIQDFRPPWSMVLVILLFFVPSFVLIAGLMTAIGSSVTETRQGQQIAGILNLLFVAPYFITSMAIANPNSPLMVGMTLFPTTALVTISLRWGFTTIPLWQLVASWLLLSTTAVFAIWASSRIFRIGMLMYGQPMNMKSIFAAVRSR
jgi:ABC-2 type transport system permease protein